MIELNVDNIQLRQLAEVLKNFGDKDLRLAVRASVKKAIEPMVRKVQSDTPVGETSALARSMGTKVKQYPRSGVTVGIVGARKGFKRQIATAGGGVRNVDPVNYLHLVALGHAKVGGGFVKGNPFLQRALRSSSRRVITTYSSEMGRRVELATRRAARKIKKAKV